MEYDGCMVSYGGGVNSSALVIWLAEQGWRGEVVFADTGTEWPETMCYVRYFDSEYLQPHGLSLTVLRGLPWQRYATGVSLIDYCEGHAMVPLAAARFCTREFKVRPLHAWAAEHGSPPMAIGIAAEESHRQPDAIRPLVDAGIDRAECVRIIEQAGLDVPPKSGCYICPFQRPAMWRLLWERHPELFERAARLEEIATERRGLRTTIQPDGVVSLRQRQAMYEGQIPMWDEAEMDGLLAYRPCLCSL